METPEQNISINALAKKGFSIIKMIEGNDPDTVSALMSKRKGPTNFHAEVESDGRVNGESLSSYLNSFK